MTPQTDRTRRAFALDEAVALLTRTPATLDALLRGLPDGWIVAHEGGDTWSPFDVVGHLIHGERTDWVPRARIILEHGEARAFDKFDRFAQFAGSEGTNAREPARRVRDVAAGTTCASWQALGLTDADLDRRGRHPELGVVTLRQLLATWVAHDLDHVVQISRSAGAAVRGRSWALAGLSAHHQRGTGLIVGGALGSTVGRILDLTGARVDRHHSWL